MGRRFLKQLFAVYVATNMMTSAILFAPWILPRETISGLIGRWIVNGCGRRHHGMARVACWIVDHIYWWEPSHCVEVYRLEEKARAILYPPP